MHTMLAVAAAHERYSNGSTINRRSRIESYHYFQSVSLFNRKLSCPIALADRDPLWATAALLGIMLSASFDAVSPEEAWPLRPCEPLDLEWFRLSEGKKAVWRLTNPLRLDSIFRSMAGEYASFNLPIPPSGTVGISAALSLVCGLNDFSNRDNNPYFVAAHVLTQLQQFSHSGHADIRMVTFMSQSHSSFRNLLHKKDPTALLLLVLWYEVASPVLWWVDQRARVESQAIRIFLQRYHCNSSVCGLLPPISREYSCVTK